MATKSNPNSMFRITQLAKDLGQKPKDLVTTLGELGVTVKSNSATLDADEVNLLFEHLSASARIKDIDGYMNGRTHITVPENPEIAAAREAKRKAEEEARIAAEKAAAEAEAKRRAEEEARIAAEKAAAEAEAKRRAEEDAKRKADEEAKRRAEEEAKRKADEAARAQAARPAQPQTRTPAQTSQTAQRPAGQATGQVGQTGSYGQRSAQGTQA